MAHQPAGTAAAGPYIGSTNNEWLHAGDVIVPGEADRYPELLDICGTWTVTSVDLAPQGPCCLPCGHMSITTDRDIRHHQRRDQPVKILAPDNCRQLAEICRQHRWHLRRSRDGLHWFVSHIDTDEVYRRLWPAADNPEADPDLDWVWGASRHGTHLGSGTGSLAISWTAVTRCSLRSRDTARLHLTPEGPF